MKIVVFGPRKRTGVLHEGDVVDISAAFAKYLHEREKERQPVRLAHALAPAELGGFINGGARALDNTKAALAHLYGGAGDHDGVGGQQIIWPADAVTTGGILVDDKKSRASRFLFHVNRVGQFQLRKCLDDVVGKGWIGRSLYTRTSDRLKRCHAVRPGRGTIRPCKNQLPVLFMLVIVPFRQRRTAGKVRLGKCPVVVIAAEGKPPAFTR